MTKKLLTLLVFATVFKLQSSSQINLFQDIWNGGVKCVSFGVGQGAGENNIDLSIPVGTTIKNIFLIVDSERQPQSTGISINDINIEIDSLHTITEVQHETIFASPVKIYYSDLLNFFVDNSIDMNNFSLKNYSTCTQSLNCGFTLCTFVVLYEDLSLQKLNLTIQIPNKNLFGQENYIINNINPINTAKPVGLSINMTRSCIADVDGTKVKINNILLGTIGGDDLGNVPSCSGSQGQYVYENQTLTALSDDNIDLAFQGTDALGDISSVLINNSIGFNVYLEHVNLQATPDFRNIYNNFIVAYSTPCDTFSVDVSSDTTICPNQTLQLSASGGVEYEWKSSSVSALQDLSCTDCPNPIFSGDSSRVYTVQIWNNDSCSVVRPVSISMRDNPTIKSITTVPALCGLANGGITIFGENTSITPLSFAIDSGAFVVSSTFGQEFSSIDVGLASVHIKDAYGCVADTTVFIGQLNPTQALFSANPSSGASPLEVSLDNNSIQATDFRWFLNGVEQTSIFSNFLADTTGLYKIELVAWQHDASCADTFALTIDVYDSLILQIPNIFSPDDDGINDVFGITVNLPISLTYFILNRWGNVIKEGNSSWSPALSLLKGGSFYPLWDGIDISEGVYFYQLKIDLIDKNENIKLEFPLKKEGFLEVVR